MRFQIGQKIPVISFIVAMNGRERSAIFFLPWDERIISSEIVYLTVTEHHKVGNGYDDAKDCDGYVLEAATGEKWFNQYPTASYGQLSTDADYYFRRAVRTEQQPYRNYVSLFTYMEGLLRGVYQFTHDEQLKNESRAQALQTIFDDLKQRYEELTDKKLVHRNHIIEFTDGSPSETMDDWFDVFPEGEEPK